MNEWLLIAVTGFGIAFFHAAIPTHWLPFVITARAQRWDRNKAIGVTALAGTGHVLFTALLGLLIAWFGIAVHQRIGSWFPWIAGGALFIFGLFYVYRQLTGTGHGHSHMFGGHSHHGATPHLHTHQPSSDSSSTGPHGGKIFDTGSGEIELAISTEQNEARFRLYPIHSHSHQPMRHLQDEGITLETIGPTKQRTHFTFQQDDGCLVSTQKLTESDPFTAVLRLTHGDHVHAFETRFPGRGDTSSVGATVDIVTSRARIPDRVAITSLLALLTFSPCESFLPVYVSGVRYGWIGFFLLTAILSLATVAGMVLFTWLALSKLEKLNLRFLERYESGIIGGLLCTLGVLIILIEK
jgi:hypothetical protein